jgi:hypothetical protein
MPGQQQESVIDPALAHAIEDAIMFGKHEELAALLADLAEDENFPADLRRDLESLRYFREHYGRMDELGAVDKKKIALMDSSWGMELLNRLRAGSADAAIKSA